MLLRYNRGEWDFLYGAHNTKNMKKKKECNVLVEAPFLYIIPSNQKIVCRKHFFF